MKFFKIIKSIDYVTYPTYKELVKISDSVSNSIASFRDIIISSIVGVLFNITPLSICITSFIKKSYPSTVLARIASFENTPLVLAIAIAIILYLGIKFGHFLHDRCESNKNTKKKRDMIVHEFYNVAIPQLIEVKSILEQVKDDHSGEMIKKLLLLLQAKYEICVLYNVLSEMNIIERNKTGLQTDDSSILHNRISACTYSTFIREMITIMLELYTALFDDYKDLAKMDINDICAYAQSSGVFDTLPEYDIELRTLINQFKKIE